MVLYQLICLTAHYREYQHIRELVRKTALQVLDNGGVVRRIHFIGTNTLPYKRVIDGHAHYVADFWQMNFDASPQLMRNVDRTLSKDPRVLRTGMIRLGSRIQDMADYKPRTIMQELTMRPPAADAPKKNAAPQL